MSLCRIFGPHGLILYFDVLRSSQKITCLYLYMNFKAMRASIHNFWPQTCVHRDVCIKTNIFEAFLIWVWISWLLAFHMPWDHWDLTLHYPFGVLFKEPLRYIKEEELKSKETIVHCCLSLHPFVPLEHIVFFLGFPLLCELAIERWRIEVVEDSFSLVHRCANRGCHYCNLWFY